MRLLFEMDAKNYDPHGTRLTRPSARCISIRDGRVAMIHSAKYDYYKFPGGGLEEGETAREALERETLEEAGLRVIPDSVREFGMTRRVEASAHSAEDIFVQDNYYYLCDTEPADSPRALDDYEAEEGFTLEYVDPDTAIRANRSQDHGPKSPLMVERETRVLEILKQEGFFGQSQGDGSAGSHSAL